MQTHDIEYVFWIFYMFIDENMFSVLSNHFRQPTRRWPGGRGPRPWLQCRRCQCLPSQGLQRNKMMAITGIKCTISWGLGYDYDYDQQ